MRSIDPFVVRLSIILRFWMRSANPFWKLGFFVRQSGFQAGDGDLLPGPEVGHHVFDGPVRRRERGGDLHFVQASQESFPTIELFTKRGDEF